MALDKFRTGDGPLTGPVLYSLTIPTPLWFVAELADAINSMCDPGNWEQVGDVTIEEASQAALMMVRSFQPMIGQILPYITTDAPTNTLPCDGASYDRVDYPDLYAVLDSAFIDSADVFHVPDLRGKTVIGVSSSHAMGSTGGSESHTLDLGEIPGHTHSTGNSFTGAAVMPGEGPVLIPNPIPAETGSAGGGGAHNNMQPFVALKYCVVCQ